MFNFIRSLFRSSALAEPIVAAPAPFVADVVVVIVPVVVSYSAYLKQQADTKRDVCFTPKGWAAYNGVEYISPK